MEEEIKDEIQEEVQDEIPDEVADEATDEVEDEFTEEEIKAVTKVAEKIGYNPNYDGPNKKSPVEYILDGRDIQKQLSESLRDKLKHIDALREDVGKVTAFVKKQSEQRVAELEKTVAELQAKRKEAVEEGDVEGFEAAEKSIKEVVDVLNTEKSQAQPKNVNKQFQQEFEKWKSDNDWYEKDEQLTLYAMGVRDKYHADPEVLKMTDSQWLGFIGEKVKEAFPHKFEKPAPKTPVSGTSSVRRGAQPKSSYSETGLTYQQKQVLDDYERMGIFKTKEERKAYIKEMLGRA